LPLAKGKKHKDRSGKGHALMRGTLRNPPRKRAPAGGGKVRTGTSPAEKKTPPNW